ncbi:hypothetical protein HS7_02520 [Sulfolobales archaeon HS-7]|nr:hypothetical protein HS7_02520 [Sulfolobales archaeon HS-7]
MIITRGLFILIIVDGRKISGEKLTLNLQIVTLLKFH